MKRLVIYIVLMIIMSCNGSKNWEGEAGIAKSSIMVGNHQGRYSSLAIFCLRDMLNGEDAGGYWTIITEPSGSTLDVSGGDNPCPDWSNEVCGQYELLYTVGDECCIDTTMVRPLKCCLEGGSICN